MDRERLRRKIQQSPRSVTLNELMKLLEAYGWMLDRVKGSHHIMKCAPECGRHTLSVPFRRPHVLPVYVEKALEFLDEEKSR